MICVSLYINDSVLKKKKAPLDVFWILASGYQFTSSEVPPQPEFRATGRCAMVPWWNRLKKSNGNNERPGVRWKVLEIGGICFFVFHDLSGFDHDLWSMCFGEDFGHDFVVISG